MLTIKPIDSTLVDYYAHLGKAENHDYYSEGGNRPGLWWGEARGALALDGEVDPAAFENLLNGLFPDGTKELVQLRKGNQLKRRAGFDLTFSLVKSFSAAWSLASPVRRKALDEVAEKALYRVLEVVQEKCGVSRRGRDGVITEKAKLVGAVFTHDTARGVPGEAPDPNKHFHVVIPNVVLREDGTYGALDARPLFQRRAKMALGALFRSELSKLLETELGIVTHRPKRERKEELASWFELQEVPVELTQAMSKRRAEIEKYLREHGLSGAKAAEKAALRTRQAKERFTWSELTEAWNKLGMKHKFTEQEVESLFGKLKEVEVNPKKESKESAKRALASLIEEKARFTENELLERTAIEAQSRGIGIDEVLEAVAHSLERNSELVRLRADQGVKAYTTKAMLRLERKMLDTARELHNRASHNVPVSLVNKVIAKHDTLRPDQTKAVRAIARGGDVTAITGVAGSGKTYMLQVARVVLEQAGHQVIGTSLASKASQGLEREAGIKSLHIHKMLHEIKQSRVKINSSSVIVVDEAGMVGTVHMERFIRLAHQRGAKLVLIGDHKQLQAISSGAPLRAIGEEIGTTEIKTIIRQRELWAREMVLNLRDGKAGQALAALDERGQLFIGEDREAAMERLVADWEALVFERGEQVGETVALSSQNLEVRELNRRIQQVMKERGQLGEYAAEVDGLDIHLGDQVMVTRNYSLLNLRNGTMAEVVGVEGNRIAILTEDGMEVEINTEDFSGLTLGYSISIHKSQGISVQNTLSILGDGMTDRELSYVAASRHRRISLVYSDELNVGGIPELAERMNRSRQKEMAIEHVLEVGE